MKMKKESEKAGLKLNIQESEIWSHHLMGKKEEQWQILFSGTQKSLQTVTAAMKFKRQFFCSLEEKSMINLDSVLKSRDSTLPTKVHLVKTMVFQ